MEDLDYLYRQMIGAGVSDLLLENHIHLDLLIADKVCGHLAYGHMGGASYGEARGRTLVGSGSTPSAAAAALLERHLPHERPKTLESALWAASVAIQLAADGIRGGREHTWYKCKQPCEKPHCVYCEGGLASCVVCKQAEVELEKVCPGHG